MLLCVHDFFKAVIPISFGKVLLSISYQKHVN